MISALHLPKPEQAELKANSVDPYVVVQIFGVPRDCDEVRTKTVYHNCKRRSFCFERINYMNKIFRGKSTI